MARRTKVVFAVHRAPENDDVLLAIPLLSGSRILHIQSVLIRDANLLRAAALPTTREVSKTGRIQDLSPLKIDEYFASMASSLRERIEALAARLGYPTTFREVEGHGYSALEPLTTEADFVAITKPDAIGAKYFSKDVDFQVPCKTTTLFVKEPWRSGSSVVIAYEGSQSDNALEVAESYANQEQLPLVLLMPSSLDHTKIRSDYQNIAVATKWDDANIASLCSQYDARLLVLGDASSGDLRGIAKNLIEAVPCSVLQVVADTNSPGYG